MIVGLWEEFLIANRNRIGGPSYKALSQTNIGVWEEVAEEDLVY
jgi:hypothetical protein